MSTNIERADRGAQALHVYGFQTGLKVDPEQPEAGDGMETAAIDLLTDIRHYFDQQGLDFSRVLLWSAEHFEGEKEEARG